MILKKTAIMVAMLLLTFLGLSNSIGADNQILNVKDFGAAGDGVTDDTSAIKKALYKGKNKKIFFPEGTYSVSDTLTIKGNTDVYGSKAIIKANKEGYTLLRAYGENITIRDLAFDGSGFVLRGLTVMNGSKNVSIHSAEFKHFGQPSSKPYSHSTPIGIRIEGGVENVMMDELIIEDVFAKNISSHVGWNHKVARGILISPALETQTGSKNITIQNSSILKIGPKDDGDGIVVQGFKENVDVNILGNTFEKNHKRAIKIQSPGAVIKDNRIHNSFMSNNFYDTYKEDKTYDMWSAISVYANHVTVEKNTITGPGSYSAAIDIAGGNHVAVKNNSIANGSVSQSSDLIRINKGVDGKSQFRDITISNNSLENGRYGVNMVANVSGLNLSNNSFSNLKSRTSANLNE
ncbi:glycosyl hydrolase family 28-related protein [Metabacillus idriensis]|uniref:glycosyl hydrolase family 28-related protein n=1 Tax=Metabacillus idriensis TaxID=324768 RepID=UPI00174C3CFC|nr:glycosyl hydrolase family 28-related protein [Metabacillus idriensis]